MNFPFLRALMGTMGAFGLTAAVHAAEVAELFSKAEAAKLLGQPITRTQVIGPEKDDDSPAEAIHWGYTNGTDGVVVTRMKFSSGAEAQKFATMSFIKKTAEGDDVKITAESGLGEKAFWVVTDEGATMTFLKGPYIVSVGLGGKNLGAPESHKSAIKAAAIGVAEKL